MLKKDLERLGEALKFPSARNFGKEFAFPFSLECRGFSQPQTLIKYFSNVLLTFSPVHTLVKS